MPLFPVEGLPFTSVCYSPEFFSFQAGVVEYIFSSSLGYMHEKHCSYPKPYAGLRGELAYVPGLSPEFFSFHFWLVVYIFSSSVDDH